MTRDRIIEIVQLLQRSELPQRKRDNFIVLLDDALPKARIIDLIYYQDPELTAEQIADEALRRST